MTPTNTIIQEQVDNLMFPRYKVVAKWPSMRDFTVDQIVVLDKKFSPQYMMYEVEDCQGQRTYISKFFDEYPHLFKKLEWWEERERDNMPQFVKITQDGLGRKAGEYHKVLNWHYYPLACIYHNHHPASVLYPATEQEYLNYINP